MFKFPDVKTLDWCVWLKAHYTGDFFIWSIYADTSQVDVYSIFGIVLIYLRAFSRGKEKTNFFLRTWIEENKSCFLNITTFGVGCNRMPMKIGDLPAWSFLIAKRALVAFLGHRDCPDIEMHVLPGVWNNTSIEDKTLINYASSHVLQSLCSLIFIS